MTYLFIDGYNIIGAWPELIHLKEENLEEARIKLIDILSEYAVSSEYNITLVFDGWRVKGNRGTVLEKPYLRIIYTAEGMTADMAIERLVASLPKHQQIYVATSDRLEQETVLAQGGLRISALELRNMVFLQKDQSKKHMVKKIEAANPLDAQLDEKVRKRLFEMIHEKNEKK